MEKNLSVFGEIQLLLSWIGQCVLFIDFQYVSYASFWNNFLKSLPSKFIVVGVLESLPKDHCFELCMYFPPPDKERRFAIIREEFRNFPVEAADAKNSVVILEKFERKLTLVHCHYEMDIRTVCKKVHTTFHTHNLQGNHLRNQ